MRIRLLFTLALFFLGDAAPVYASLGPAPECLPSSQQSKIDVPGTIPADGVVAHFDAEDRDYMIRTIVFEADGEAEEGKIAVAYVIINRIRDGWGGSIKEVVTSPWQFEPWMTKRAEMEKLSQDDPRYLSAAQITDTVLAGQMPDPTAGAVYFLNPTIVRQRRGGSLPSWAQGDGQAIGNHTFYRADEGVMLEQPILSTGQLATSLSCTRFEAGEASPVG